MVIKGALSSKFFLKKHNYYKKKHICILEHFGTIEKIRYFNFVLICICFRIQEVHGIYGDKVSFLLCHICSFSSPQLGASSIHDSAFCFLFSLLGFWVLFLCNWRFCVYKRVTWPNFHGWKIAWAIVWRTDSLRQSSARPSVHSSIHLWSIGFIFPLAKIFMHFYSAIF